MHIDTTVVLELLGGRPNQLLVERIQKEVGAEPLMVATIQFAEVADASKRHGLDTDDIVARLASLVEVVPIDVSVALLAADLKHEARKHRESRDFSLMDGVILAAARSRGQKLLTLDPDFRPFSDAVVLAP